MLRGVARCLRRSRRPMKHRIKASPYNPPFLICTRLVRDLSSVGVEQGETSAEKTAGRATCVNQSFTSTHYVPDGRKFQFATVVARRMEKGESPIQIWDQACALIGGNSPTLAVAFVSKPTESAQRSVQVLASLLSASLSKNSAVSCQPPPSCGSSDSNSGRQASTTSSETDNKVEHIPLIGCLMDDLGGEIVSSDDTGSSTIQRGSSLPTLQFRSQEEFSHMGDAGDGQQDDEGARVVGFRSGSAFLALDGVNVQEDGDGDEGTVSDWENLCSEYSEEVIKALDSRSESEDDEEDCENGLAEHISKEGLVSFLNALVRYRNPFEDSGVVGDVRSMTRGEQNTGLQRTTVEAGWNIGTNREVFVRTATGDVVVTELQRRLNSSRLGLSSRQSSSERVLASNGLFGDYEGTITVEQKHGGDQAGVSGSDLGKENVNYKLVLCVAHMPGVKAVAFHSHTTGLPRLPDLEDAVLENNPHMFLLGAPGFVFSEFIKRLSSVFPASCRAGAFLSPLFTRKKNQWTRDTTQKGLSPLFLGDQIFTSGVVGLAISSKVKGLDVPVGAFAELARMSVGMPRIQGYIFLDESVSKSLFLPSNVGLQNVYGSFKGSKLTQSTVLDHLNKQLLKENAATHLPQVSPGDRPADLALELDATDDPERWRLLSSNVAGELRVLDRLPLASLDSVLFPGWSTMFYIYEPCYRLMVKQCVEQGKPFGLSSMYSDSWTADGLGFGEVIGTLVNLKILTFENDCRSHIIARGVRRFKVVDERMWSEPGSFGLNVGQVQFFDDEECKTAEEKQELLDLAKRAVSLCCEVVSEAQSVPGLVNSTHDPRLASFGIGHLLNVPTRVKRRWLKMVNTKTRLLEQMTFLETKVPI